MSPSTSKKRKRADSGGVTIKLTTPPAGQVGPVIVSFPALEPPPSTAFSSYARKKSKVKSKAADEEDDLGSQRMIAGEAPSVEFFSSFENGEDTGCRYILALHTLSTNTLHIPPTPTPLHILAHTVKALKNLPSSTPSALQYKEARTALGETFGTKKAKAQIRAEERGKVDVDAMKGVVSFLQDGIEKGSKGMLTTEEAKEALDTARLIPPFSATATDPAEVYPLHDIIPDLEWKALSACVIAFDDTEDSREREGMLPWRRSIWVNQHLGRVGKGKEGKRNLRILYYISTMLAFRNTVDRHKGGVEKDGAYERLEGVPSVVVDSLLSRFTEVPRGSNNNVSTTATQTLLLTHIFALCLRVDNWATDTTILSSDLSLAVTKVNQLFKSLGCKIGLLGERERARLGLPDSAGATKRATLSAPVVFPKQRMQRKGGK